MNAQTPNRSGWEFQYRMSRPLRPDHPPWTDVLKDFSHRQMSVNKDAVDGKLHEPRMNVVTGTYPKALFVSERTSSEKPFSTGKKTLSDLEITKKNLLASSATQNHQATAPPHHT